MQKDKKQLEVSLIGLFTIPFFFIILYGLLSLKYTSFYLHIDEIIFIFVALLIILMSTSTHYYRRYNQQQEDDSKPYHSMDDEIRMPHIADDESAVFVKHIANSETVMIHNMIGKGSTFIGDFDTLEDVLIEGALKGNVVTSQDVFLDGFIEGNVNCQYLAMKESRIIGNVCCKKELFMDEICMIKGNVMTDELILHGKIVGDLCVRNHLKLTPTSVIIGDIDCTNIDFAHGAVIKGKVCIK